MLGTYRNSQSFLQLDQVVFVPKPNQSATVSQRAKLYFKESKQTLLLNCYISLQSPRKKSFSFNQKLPKLSCNLSQPWLQTFVMPKQTCVSTWMNHHSIYLKKVEGELSDHTVWQSFLSTHWHSGLWPRGLRRAGSLSERSALPHKGQFVLKLQNKFEPSTQSVTPLCRLCIKEHSVFMFVTHSPCFQTLHGNIKSPSVL